MSAFARNPKLAAGTRAFTNGNVLLSMGALDSLLFGGGLVSSSVVLLKSDADATLTDMLAEMFVSHGVTSRQHAIVCSGPTDPLASKRFNERRFTELVQQVSSPRTQSAPPAKPGDHKLVIAWRYRHLVQPSSPEGSSTASKAVAAAAAASPLSSDDIAAVLQFVSQLKFQLPALDATNTTPPQAPPSSAFPYASFVDELDASLLRAGASPARLCLLDFASAAWCSTGANDEVNLVRLVMHAQRRARAHAAGAVTLICLPHGVASESLTSRLEHLCDTVLSVRCFRHAYDDTADGDDEYADYDGVVSVDKWCALNTLVPLASIGSDGVSQFLFRHRHGALHMERLFLPPESSRAETAPSSSSHASSAAAHVHTSSCTSGHGHNAAGRSGAGATTRAASGGSTTRPGSRVLDF